MARTKTPLNQPSLNTIETFPILDLEESQEKGQNIIKGKAVVLVDPSTGKTVGNLNPLRTSLADPTTPTTIAQISAPFEGAVITTTPALATDSIQRVFDGTSFFRVRTPKVFKQAELAAAPATTDIWLPTNKFRVMGGVITMSGLIAAAATRTLKLIEETAGTVILEVAVTIPVLGFNLSIPFDIKPNGYQASTAAKKLQAVTAGGTYTTGIDVVSVWGTDE